MNTGNGPMPGSCDGAGFVMRAGRFVARLAMFGRRDDFDWMAILWRDVGTPWHLTSRFHYYHDGSKSWTCVELNGVRDDAARAGFSLVAERVQDHFSSFGSGGGELEMLAIDSDDPMVVTEALARNEWARITWLGKADKPS